MYIYFVDATLFANGTNFPFRLTVLCTAQFRGLSWTFRPMAEVSGGFLPTPWHNQLNMMWMFVRIQKVSRYNSWGANKQQKRRLRAQQLLIYLFNTILAQWRSALLQLIWIIVRKLCGSRVYNLNRFWQGRLDCRETIPQRHLRAIVATTAHGMINVKPEVGNGKSVGSSLENEGVENVVSFGWDSGGVGPGTSPNDGLADANERQMRKWWSCSDADDSDVSQWGRAILLHQTLNIIHRAPYRIICLPRP